MRRAQSVALVVLGLVVIFFVAGSLVGGGKRTQLEKRAEGSAPRTEPQAPGISLENLLSGLVGAALTALIAVGYTEIREERERVRARLGYVRLLSHELEANQPVVNEIVRRHQARFVIDLDKYDYPLPYIEIWPEIRGNLAPLININEFASLDDYHRQLQVLWDKKRANECPVPWGANQ